MAIHDTPQTRVRRVARWRTALVSTALTTSIGLSGLIGIHVAADAADAPDGSSFVTTDDSSSTTTSSRSTSDSGVSSGSSSSSDATSGGS